MLNNRHLLNKNLSKNQLNQNHPKLIKIYLLKIITYPNYSIYYNNNYNKISHKRKFKHSKRMWVKSNKRVVKIEYKKKQKNNK